MTSVRRRRNSGFAPKLGSRRKDCQAQKRMETAPTPHHTHHMKWMGCKSTLFLFIITELLPLAAAVTLPRIPQHIGQHSTKIQSVRYLAVVAFEGHACATLPSA
ncbi:hypothetical protein BD311DRAFT_748760 [Dichomitus squalens]|uniref:Uncharacterized protein n=1 Tax=Dichomitus squalens TaxID=114155 RepID=A0A4Q9MZF6_9APHY|nr:hypothetical protein BD311DRAFT_748760 [Dichomitus squalens]